MGKGQIRIVRIPFTEYREDKRPIHPRMEEVEREAREELACALDEGYEVVSQFTVAQKGHLTLVLVLYLHPALEDSDAENCLSEVNDTVNGNGHGGE